MEILAIGATGEFAGLVVPELKKRGHTVTGLVRDKKKGAGALRNGADKIVVGNLDDRAGLQEASKGMEGVYYLNCSSRFVCKPFI
jgi:uncharacterized protein YbjT (DUF2867 family)